MTHYKIKKGYDIPINGRPQRKLDSLPAPAFVAIKPSTFTGVKARLNVAIDDQVKVGTPLFHDKNNPDMIFGSPGAGRVTAINYGPRRVIEQIVVACDEQQAYEQHTSYGLGEIAQLERATLVKQLLAGGMWPLIRQRPYNHIANADDQPVNIFVNMMDTAPLAADPNFALTGKEDAFEAGLTALKVLTANTLFVATTKDVDKGFCRFNGAEYHSFAGKHPAGLVSTHIGKLAPINRGDVVWYLNARDVVLMGSFLLEGRMPVERVVGVGGSGATRRQYFKTQMGVKIGDVVGDHMVDGELRLISGNVLTGTHTDADDFLDFYDDLVTVIPEGRERHFLGWITPGFGAWSYGRTHLSSFMPGKTFDMNTNINGGHRAMVVSGLYERVIPLDICPEFLIKATMAGDIDAMEQLGILEVDAEDFALSAYICPSKLELTDIIRFGLELMEKEA